MGYNKPNNFIKEEVGWDARREFCSFIIEKARDLFMFLEDRDNYKYQVCFKCLVSMTSPYINDRMAKDKVIFNFDDVEQTLAGLKPDDSDFNTARNAIIYNKIGQLMYEKQKILFEYLAKERLLMPIYEKKDLNQSIKEM
jgi:hypothetical protein